MQIFKAIWRVVKNPFLTTTALFIVWMVFFDSNSYLNRKKQEDRKEELQKREGFYQEEINRLNDELQAIDEDPEELEKFAREKFFYKEKGEDIFVLEEKAKK